MKLSPVKEDFVTEMDRKPTNLERVPRITRVIAMITLVVYAIVSVGLWGWYFSIDNSRQVLVGSIVFTGAFVASLVAYLLQRRKKYDLANAVILATLLAIGVFPSFIYSGTGYLTALVFLSLAILLASYVLLNRQLLLFFAFGFGSLVLAQFGDTFGPSGRPLMLQPVVATTISIFLAIALVVVIILRFRYFPFQAKIVVGTFGFAVSVALIIVGMTGYLSSESMTQKGYSSLVTAAHLVSGSVDQFIGTTLSDLEVQARNPDLSLILSGSNSPGQMRQGAEEVLDRLASKGDYSKSANNPHQFLHAYLLIDRLGKVVYDSSGLQTNQDLFTAQYFQRSIKNPLPFVSPVYASAQDEGVLYFSAQVQGQDGSPAGVLAARFDAAIFQQFLNKNNNLVSNQSYAILVDEYGLLLAQGNISAGLYRPIKSIDDRTAAELSDQSRLVPAANGSPNGKMPDLGRQLKFAPGISSLVFRAEENSGGEYYYAATEFLQLQPWTVIYVVPQAILLEPVVAQMRFVQLLVLVILFIILAIAYFLSRSLAAPFRNMIDTTTAIAGGNFAARVEVQLADEIGALGESINNLGARMQASLHNMERKNEDRSNSLERRVSQLQAAAEIGRSLSTIQNINELLDRSVTLISQRFNYFHVGIYLIDDSGRFAVLRATNSEGGKQMLARSHRLAVGQQGIVGYVTSTGRSRIALDVGPEAIFFSNPDLPGTRSEIAIPLVSGERILGALDIQSTEPGAFTSEDYSILQVLADFLAVTIENGRLLLDTRSALEALRHSYGELSQRSWVDHLGNVTDIGFRSLDRGIFSIANAPAETGPDGGQKLSIPIRVRDTLVGYVDAVKPSNRGEWTKEELDTVDALVDQLGVALESARLFENTQLLAERERLVSDFNARLQESLDVDTVLRTAVSEMRQIIGSRQVTLVLGKGDES